jgi:hypothetical protein
MYNSLMFGDLADPGHVSPFCKWHNLPVEVLHFDVTGVKTIVMQNSPYLSWNTSLHRISVNTSVVALLNFTEYITSSFTPVLCMFCFCLWEATSLSKFLCTVYNTFWCGTPWCGRCFWYFTPASLPSPFKKLICLYILCICGRYDWLFVHWKAVTGLECNWKEMHYGCAGALCYTSN